MLPDGSINPGGMTSFNHYALGAVAAWLERTVGGLAPAEPGYRVIEVAPVPGGGGRIGRSGPRDRSAVASHRHRLAAIRSPTPGPVRPSCAAPRTGSRSKRPPEPARTRTLEHSDRPEAQGARV